MASRGSASGSGIGSGSSSSNAAGSGGLGAAQILNATRVIPPNEAGDGEAEIDSAN